TSKKLNGPTIEGIEKPGMGELMRRPEAFRLSCSTVSLIFAFTFGSNALRATLLWPRAWRTAWLNPTAPRLYSIARWTASSNERRPEKGILEVLGVLPANEPWTW